MKAAAQRALLSLERRNKASNVFLKKRFSLVKQLENERDKMETRLDDARVKWSEDDEYETGAAKLRNSERPTHWPCVYYADHLRLAPAPAPVSSLLPSRSLLYKKKVTWFS